MYECAIRVLNKISEAGFDAYIVGGYPRNKYLGIKSTDIDICTSATPEDMLAIFPDVDMKHSLYGSLRLKYDKYYYEITTFRRDNSVGDGNRFYDVEFVKSLKEDLLRRDFIMNTLCIDNNGEYVDYLGAINDIDSKIVRTVKDPNVSFREDPLRILRAIRFATTLSFSLDHELESGLNSSKTFLANLSLYHVKQELNLMFKSINVMDGINYLVKFGIDKILGLDLSNIKYCSNYLGIWAQVNCLDMFEFSNNEKEIINKIMKLLSSTPSFSLLYEYGNDICEIVDEVNEDDSYHNLNKIIPIHSRDDINIDKQFIFSNIPPELISTTYKKLESLILSGELLNDSGCIKKYIQDNVKSII